MKPCSNTTARVLRLALMSTLLITVAGDASAATTKVDIDTVPPGVQVFLADIEGEESPLGTTPLSAVRLPRGQHTLRFSKEGYKALVETLEVGKRPSRFVFKLERKTRPGTLEFRALERFHGAAIAIDGKVVGALPTTVPVPAGRHLAKITKEGYEPWERWFDVKEGEQLPVDVTLSALSAPMGSLLVTSNPSGAEVRVDGVGRGVAPTAIQGLAPGSHRVTLQLEGYAPYDKEVTISVGEQAVLEAVLESAKPTTGSIKVLANAEGASLRFDGEAVGKAPFTREGIAPGLHLIEASAPGHADAQREITIRAGETSVVRLTLQTLGEAKPPAAGVEPATLRVTCDTEGAVVSLDGAEAVPAPATLSVATPGTHFVKVSAPGHSAWSRQVTTTAGQSLELNATLSALGTLEVKVASGEEATVSVQGEPLGKTPLEHALDVGEVEVKVTRGEAEAESHTVSIEGGETTSLVVFDPETPLEAGRTMPYSARTIATGLGSLDISLGWPYIGELRINGGVADNLEVGFSFRNMFDAISEFEGRVKYTVARNSVVGFATEVGIGGGGGSQDRNSFIFRALALGSVFIGDKVALTARVGGLVFTDRLALEGLVAKTPLQIDERDTALEFHAGMTIEFAVAESWNFFLLFDGMPFRTGSYQVTEGGEVVDLQGRLLFYEGIAEDAKAQRFRASAGATFLF